MRIANAQIVLDDEVRRGSITISDGLINDVGDDGTADVDCEGDFILPGLVDLHTDNLEHYMLPRPGVRWPSPLAAVLAHDWQLLGSGITTVLDAVGLGDLDSGSTRAAMLETAIAALTRARADGLFRLEHYFHFRCELSDEGLLPIVHAHIDNPGLKLVSVMDHTPGQRQWSDLALFREFRRKKSAHVWTDREFEVYLGELQGRQKTLVPPNRATLGSLCRERDIPLASHDDTTVRDVEESYSDGITISEFPTTVEAAQRARERGMTIVMGSPNIILGGSHSGNVSAMELANVELLDVLTSDYVPGSLLHSVFRLAAKGFDLPKAIAMVTKNPAELLGFVDRGRIALGLRADLIRVRLVEGVPVIRNIWVAGRQYL